MFFLFSSGICFSQDTENDSDKVRIGPDEIISPKGGHFFNFADKNKVNIEVIVLGISAGKYLIPQGTTLFDFMIMIGGTQDYVLEEIKIVRFKSESPKLQATEVKNYHLDNLYGDKADILKPMNNPPLKPGDMLILPNAKPPSQSIFYYIQTTVSFVATILSFYYLIDNLTYRYYR